MDTPRLRVLVCRVAHPSGVDDCVVRRVVAQRLHPDGIHWLAVGAEEDPTSSHYADVEAMRLAATWDERPEYGYAIWSAGGPVWIEAFVDGERWTPIPR